MDQDKIKDLRDHYDGTDVAEHFADAELDTRITTEVLVSTSIRLAQSLVNQVRDQAATLGIPATTSCASGLLKRPPQLLLPPWCPSPNSNASSPNEATESRPEPRWRARGGVLSGAAR